MAKKERRIVCIRKEREPYSATGFAFRAYHADGVPYYLAGETLKEAKRRVRDSMQPWAAPVFKCPR